MSQKRRTVAITIGMLAAAFTWGAMVTTAGAQEGGQTGGSTGSFYSQEQAARGATVFQSRCSGCHNTDLTGEKRGSARGGPPLTGPQFMSNWEGESLDGLLTRMKTLMPRDDPGGLADEVYLDLVAYVSKVNGFPGGSAPLTSDIVADLQIPQKSGPAKAIGNFKMVAVVGCLAQADDVWSLTHTVAPVVTKDQPATAAELQQAEAAPLGADTFRLVSVAPFRPDSSRGHRVLAKGLLYRTTPGPNRLNVTSLQPLGASCTN
jgi:mono/diheme cytochrome c family protein